MEVHYFLGETLRENYLEKKNKNNNTHSCHTSVLRYCAGGEDTRGQNSVFRDRISRPATAGGGHDTQHGSGSAASYCKRGFTALCTKVHCDEQYWNGELLEVGALPSDANPRR